MRITIHRGSRQVGGCITEISTGQTKIFIDLGHNLPGTGETADEFANEEAVKRLTEGCNAIFYTHYHGDHIDLFRFVPDHVPQYAGEGAVEVMCCKYETLRQVMDTSVELYKLSLFKTFKAREKIAVGDMMVTPFYVSHSAFDAYMFLVEAEGKRVLHMGDFRDHGYMGKGLYLMLQQMAGRVDVLITEGTMLSRHTVTTMSEPMLQRRIFEEMHRCKYVFALCSSTDIDRLASFHAANSRMHQRPFVCLGYQEEVLKIFAKRCRSGLYKFDRRVYTYSPNNVKLQNWMCKAGFCMLIRTSQKERVKEVIDMVGKENALLIYSMWRGYYDRSLSAYSPEVEELRRMFGSHVVDVHTSGHAACDTLCRVCVELKPTTAIIPIHKDHSADFASILPEELKGLVVTQDCKFEGLEVKI